MLQNFHGICLLYMNEDVSLIVLMSSPTGKAILNGRINKRLSKRRSWVEQFYTYDEVINDCWPEILRIYCHIVATEMTDKCVLNRCIYNDKPKFNVLFMRNDVNRNKITIRKITHGSEFYSLGIWKFKFLNKSIMSIFS